MSSKYIKNNQHPQLTIEAFLFSILVTAWLPLVSLQTLVVFLFSLF